MALNSSTVRLFLMLPLIYFLDDLQLDASTELQLN